jgi:hypothetical protein
MEPPYQLVERCASGYGLLTCGFRKIYQRLFEPEALVVAALGVEE